MATAVAAESHNPAQPPAQASTISYKLVQHPDTGLSIARLSQHHACCAAQADDAARAATRHAGCRPSAKPNCSPAQCFCVCTVVYD
jgi:hypothetical protein